MLTTKLGRDPAVAFTFGNNQWTLDNASFANTSSSETNLYFDLVINPGESLSLLTFSSLYLDSVANSIPDMTNAELNALALSSDPISQGVSLAMVARAINYSSIPEPASVALLGLGLVGIGFSRRKKKA